ncbi:MULTISPECIES: CRTAC1 family protein [Virgibacillus]|uniref:CRTAC1 family protein n=1 Tax=Virgibacillus TaxID=84406 RepID=UPI001840A64D|nr:MULTISPECIES: CRTAC1 family protein [Virgibacillus]MBU5265963.1 CRTAC1 family protein [Virgibacillus proomii]NWO15090.1 CRTAC1 family protein [Virgibacillus sp.]
MKNHKILFLIVGLLISVGCTAINTDTAGQSKKQKHDITFNYTDITAESNVDFNHLKPTFDPKVDNIMPWLASTGASVAVADYDNDGYYDLYFTNSKKGSENGLYRNKGDGTFEKVDSITTDINHDSVSTTALFFDYNNDGYPDLFVGSWGYSKLFKNNGDGTFTDVTEEANTTKFGYAAKAIALDYNKDGHLDLYVANYFRSENNLWDLETTKIMHDDFETAVNGGKNYLYRNNGDGTFTEVAGDLGVDDTGWTLSTGSVDLNHDGYPDIYNANDFGPDSLYINQNGEGFKRVTQPNNFGNDTHKGMNVDFADIFHKGEYGIYVSNVSKDSYIIEGNDFWYPNENGEYEEIADKLKINYAGFSWGAKFFDVNNSGEFSLAVTNGFITGESDDDYWFDLGTLVTTPGNVVEDTKNWPTIGDKDLSGNENKFLFLNPGNGKEFIDVAEEAGINFTSDGRGISVVDIDNSGELDLVFANQNAPAKVYKNNISNDNNWITIELEGSPPSNRDAIGAKVTIITEDKETLIERDGGNGFGGQSDPRIHFGTDSNEVIKEIKIVWPSGRVQSLENVETNQFLSIKEDASIPMK